MDKLSDRDLLNFCIANKSNSKLWDLVKFLVKSGANNYQGGLDTASKINNFEMFNYFESLYQPTIDEYEEALDYAKDYNNIEMIKMIQDKINNY